jgi:hypothetical protein
MKRKFLFAMSVLASVVFSVNVLASPIFPVSVGASGGSCPLSLLHGNPKFCSGSSRSFPAVVICQCKLQSPSPLFCSSAHQIYHLMTIRYMRYAPHQITQACVVAFKQGWTVSVQECRDQWHCFLNGGTYDGTQCQGNGSACPSNSI